MGVKIPYEDDFFMKMIFFQIYQHNWIVYASFYTNFKSISNNSKRGKSIVQTD